MKRTFDRIPKLDDRSRRFPIRAMIGRQKAPRSYTWGCEAWLDQGEEGACVGHAWAHELAARPAVVIEATADLAGQIYRRAQTLDEWEGEDYEGTSVLAGAKAVQELGYISEYRWAFGLDDLVLAVGYCGPAVLGVDWYEGMADVHGCGYVHPVGECLGGHAILARGVDVPNERFLLHNSWGDGWGRHGSAWIAFDELEELLDEGGEACIPIVRRNKASIVGGVGGDHR